MTPADVRALADRIRKDGRLAPTARAVCAAVLEGVAARMERGEW